jgi:hypothetical protein
LEKVKIKAKVVVNHGCATFLSQRASPMLWADSLTAR